MTRRILTLTTALALSASLAFADQARQRWPSSSSSGSGSQSGGGQGSGGGQSSGGSGGGQSSGGGAQSSGGGGQRSAGQSSGGGGGSQVQRWGAPRQQSAPPPAPRSGSSGGSEERAGSPRAESAPPPAPRSSGGSQLQRWANRRDDAPREEPTVSAPRTSPSPFFTSPGSNRSAVSRAPVENAAAPATGQPLANQPVTSQGAVRAGVTDGGQRVAQPRQRVPSPQDQQTAGAYAVPRGTVASAPRVTSDNDRFRVRSTTRVYNNYYYYPRHSYPYGFGSYGLGYFYYDPYAWYDPYPIHYSYPYASYPSYAANVYQYRYGYPTGEIRLHVRPRHAEVYVDGYYAGRVDEFDGVFQSLRIEEGPHMIEIVAPGYTTLIFNVRIVAGRKIDYRADLLPY